MKTKDSKFPDCLNLKITGHASEQGYFFNYFAVSGINLNEFDEFCSVSRSILGRFLYLMDAEIFLESISKKHLYSQLRIVEVPVFFSINEFCLRENSSFEDY